MDLTFFIGVIAGSVVLWGWLVRHWLPRLAAFFAIAGIAFVGGAGFATSQHEQAEAIKAASAQLPAIAADTQKAICEVRMAEVDAKLRPPTLEDVNCVFGPPPAPTPYRR